MVSHSLSSTEASPASPNMVEATTLGKPTKSLDEGNYLYDVKNCNSHNVLIGSVEMCALLLFFITKIVMSEKVS